MYQHANSCVASSSTSGIIARCLSLSQAVGPSSSVLSTLTGSSSPVFLTGFLGSYLEKLGVQSVTFCLQNMCSPTEL